MSEVREALTATGASALVPKIISPMLLDYQRRYSALVRMIPSVKWDSDTYYFNTMTQRGAGGFVTDGGTRPVTSSTYQQNNFKIRNMLAIGAVTGYSQAVTRGVIGDLKAKEVANAIQGLYWDIETGAGWGNAAATQFGPYPQFDGFDTAINQFTGGNQNSQDKNNGTLTLAMLDELIDMVEMNSAMDVFNSRWMLVMSNTATSKIAQLLTNQQRFNDRVEAEAGLLVPTYRDIPLVKSSFLSTRNMTMTAVSATGSATGGTLPAGTYYYKVSPIIARQGELVASGEVSSGALTGTTSSVTLNFTTPTGLDGSQPILFKVFRGTATGAETLLGVVDANVGLSADGVTPILATSIVDTGSALIPQNGSTQPANTPAAYVSTNANIFPQVAGSESIFLVSRDEDHVVRPYVRELEPVDVYPTTAGPDQLPFAIVSDTTMAYRAPKFLGRLSRVNVAV